MAAPARPSTLSRLGSPDVAVYISPLPAGAANPAPPMVVETP